MIKLIIADDHRMFRESLRMILSVKRIAEVEAEASNGFELLDLLDVYKPNIILMDIAMPRMNGIEATKKAIEKQPNVKVLALSSFDDENYYYSMVESGAVGFILKNAGITELKKAITEVANGGNWFSTELIQKVMANINAKPKKNITQSLTERELEVLKMICESCTNEQIAERLNLSIDTIKWHRSNLLSKSGCSNSAGLVIYAIKNNLIEI